MQLVSPGAGRSGGPGRRSGCRTTNRARRSARPARLRRRRARGRHRDDRALDGQELHLRRPGPGARHDRLALAGHSRTGLRRVRVRVAGQGLHHRRGPGRRAQGDPDPRGQGIQHRHGPGQYPECEPRPLRHAPHPAALHRRTGHLEHPEAARVEGRGPDRLPADEHHHPDGLGLQHPQAAHDPRSHRRLVAPRRARGHQDRARRRRDAGRTDLRDLWRRGLADRCRTAAAPRCAQAAQRA